MALVIVFVMLTFPSPRLKGRAQRELERFTGAAVSMESFRFGFGWLGPSMRIKNLVFQWEGVPPFTLSRANLRPAWSTAWLHGSALRIDGVGDLGHVEGAAVFGREMRFAGSLRARELQRFESIGRTWYLTGILDAEFDLVRNGNLLDGTVSLQVRDGTFRMLKLLAPIPFQQLDALLRFADGVLNIESFRLRGPLLSMSLAGTIDPADRLEQARLQLEAQVHADEPGIRNAMALQGLSFTPEGEANVRVLGTLSAPVVQ